MCLGCQMHIDELIHTYLEACDVEGKTANTVWSYRTSLADFRRTGTRLGLPEMVEAYTVPDVRRDRPDLIAEIRRVPGVEFAELVPDGVFSKLRVFSQDSAPPVERIRDIAGQDNIEDVLQRGRTLEEAYIAFLR